MHFFILNLSKLFFIYFFNLLHLSTINECQVNPSVNCVLLFYLLLFHRTVEFVFICFLFKLLIRWVLCFIKTSRSIWSFLRILFGFRFRFWSKTTASYLFTHLWNIFFNEFNQYKLLINVVIYISEWHILKISKKTR